MPHSQRAAPLPPVPNTQLSPQCHKYSKSEGKDLLKRLGDGRVYFFVLGGVLGVTVILSLIGRHIFSSNPSRRELLAGLPALEQHAIPRASHAERLNPSRCHQTSCTSILDQINAWSNQRNSKTPRFFWLHGSGGIGKSTVAQTIAEQWDDQRKLAASVFFSQMIEQTRSAIPTIASQMARRLPGYGDAVAQSVDQNPEIFVKSLTEQAEQLILGPLVAIYGNDSAAIPPKTILLDGIDEIASPQEQLALLDVLGNAIVDRQLPLQLLITSRPETHIQEGLSLHPFNSSLISFNLDSQKKKQAISNVEALLISEFTTMKEAYPWLKNTPWPSSQVISALVQLSQGSLAYPAAVMQHLNKMGGNPRHTLDTLLKFAPIQGNASKSKDVPPSAPLDGLYNHILSALPWQTQALVSDISSYWITHLSSQAKGEQAGLQFNSLGEFSKLLLFDTSELEWYLQTLSSVFNLSPPALPSPEGQPASSADRHVGPSHRMFLDFLGNASRSGDFHLSVGHAHARLAHTYLKHMAVQMSGSEHAAGLSSLPREEVEKALQRHLAQGEPQAELREALLAVIRGRRKTYRKFIENEKVGLEHLGLERQSTLFEVLPAPVMREVVAYLQRSNDALRPPSWSKSFTKLRLRMYNIILHRFFWDLFFPGGFLEPLLRWFLVV